VASAHKTVHISLSRDRGRLGSDGAILIERALAELAPATWRCFAAIRRALITWFPDFEQVIVVQHSKQFKRAHTGSIFASPEFAIGFVLAVMAYVHVRRRHLSAMPPSRLRS
jgi:hypothetical protein